MYGSRSQVHLHVMNGWYDTPKKKVDSAIRIFETSEAISYPKYLTRAITFGM